MPNRFSACNADSFYGKELKISPISVKIFFRIYCAKNLEKNSLNNSKWNATKKYCVNIVYSEQEGVGIAKKDHGSFFLEMARSKHLTCGQLYAVYGCGRGVGEHISYT
jgi:hypothetical protein